MQERRAHRIVKCMNAARAMQETGRRQGKDGAKFYAAAKKADSYIIKMCVDLMQMCEHK